MCASSCRVRASVLWEGLPSKRVTESPYSPLRIGSSQTVPAVLPRHLQSPPITCRARPSPGVTRQIPQPETPAVPPSIPGSHPDAKIPVRSGRPLRYCGPPHPGPKADGLDAWVHCSPNSFGAATKHYAWPLLLAL